MSDTNLYYQCRLTQEFTGGTYTIVAWIEERGAKAEYVELEDEEGLWYVDETFKPGRDMVWLQEQGIRARRGLPSTTNSR